MHDPFRHEAVQAVRRDSVLVVRLLASWCHPVFCKSKFSKSSKPPYPEEVVVVVKAVG